MRKNIKIVIRIPCLNEQDTLPATVRDLPRTIPGVDCVEYLVIDDGSTDRTAEVATECGVHHVLSLGTNRGLATAFSRGLEFCMGLGADIVVNTDADNQYRAEDIPALTQPILAGVADMVVGCRPIADHPEFGLAKKLLQSFGSWCLRRVSRTTVRDAASGFRAFSRETCMRIFVHSRFSYCMETLIQAGNTGMRVCSVEVGVNPKVRESRLFRSIPQYVARSGATMVAMFVLYRPGAFFVSLAWLALFPAVLIGVRFLYYAYYVGHGPGRHLASLILLAILAFCSLGFVVLGVIGELLKGNRRLSEEILFNVRVQG